MYNSLQSRRIFRAGALNNPSLLSSWARKHVRAGASQKFISCYPPPSPLSFLRIRELNLLFSARPCKTPALQARCIMNDTTLSLSFNGKNYKAMSPLRLLRIRNKNSVCLKHEALENKAFWIECWTPESSAFKQIAKRSVGTYCYPVTNPEKL